MRSRVRRGEVRGVGRDVRWLRVRNGRVARQTGTRERGIGVRVLDGGWGFAASRDLSGAAEVAGRATALARATAPHASPEIDPGEPGALAAPRVLQRDSQVPGRCAP